MDLTEHLINNFYDALAKEHQTILKDLKDDKGEEETEKKVKSLHVEVSHINKMMSDVIKLRTMRKKISSL
jgi:hypothetical protein